MSFVFVLGTKTIGMLQISISELCVCTPPPAVGYLGPLGTGLSIASRLEDMLAGDTYTHIDVGVIVGVSVFLGPGVGFVVTLTTGVVGETLKRQEQIGYYRMYIESNNLNRALEESIVGWEE